jgi:ParB family chromosome partitioning protein
VSKDRRLGRGLAALLGSPLGEEDVVAPVASQSTATIPAPHFATDTFVPSEATDAASMQLNVYDIDDNPYQPRRDFNEAEIASLAESLKTHDMLQPILVRRVGQRYQLISGERRLRAAIQAGWKMVPVRVKEADDRLVAELAIVENLQRKDLNPIEKALSFKRYLDEHRCTQEELAKRLKIDRSQIANLMRLLELPQTVLDSIRNNKISVGHARALLPLGNERKLIELAGRIEQDDLSVREVESLVAIELALEDGVPVVSDKPRTKTAEKKQTNKRSMQMASLEEEFRRALGAKIEISARSNAKGRIIIHYNNQEDFSRIREHITGTVANVD